MKNLPENIIYATSKELERTIHEFQDLDYNTIEVDSIKGLLKPLLSGHFAVSSPIIPLNHKFYRGVKRKEKPQNICELTYPPPANVKSFQRANRPGESMFYCSTSRNTPAYELSLVQGDYVAISRWRNSKRMVFNNVGYTQEIFVDKGADRICPNWGDEKDPPSWATLENQIVTRFLAKEFTKIVPIGKEVHYKTSVAIAEELTQRDITFPNGKKIKFAGLLYPTIAMRANDDNLAVKPEFVDLHFKLDQVEYLRVDTHPDTEYVYNVTILDFANTFSPDGTILWKGRRSQWQLRPGERLNLKIENGCMVARNSAGEIVDPEF